METEPKARDRLGVPRKVDICVHAELTTGFVHLVLLKCGHWVKAEKRIEPGTEVGCTGCDALERLGRMLDHRSEQVNSAIVMANCHINGHSDSCNRETWNRMLGKLGSTVRELPENEPKHDVV